MKRLFTTAMMAIVVFVSSLFGQSNLPDTYTAGLSNGRLWTVLTAELRTTYLLGYRDHHIVFSNQDVPESSVSEKESAWWPKLSIAEAQRGLDRFYEAPENLVLPIRYGLRVLAMRVAGTPDAEINGWLSGYRRIFTKTDGGGKKAAENKESHQRRIHFRTRPNSLPGRPSRRWRASRSARCCRNSRLVTGLLFHCAIPLESGVVCTTEECRPCRSSA